MSRAPSRLASLVFGHPLGHPFGLPFVFGLPRAFGLPLAFGLPRAFGLPLALGAFGLPLAFAACRPASTMPPPAADSPRVQAALAVVTVENRTAITLIIAFRPAGQERGRVSIGSVPAGRTRRLAPVPATEPIVLSARTPEGGTFELPARTFALDEQWLWVIPPETVFR